MISGFIVIQWLYRHLSKPERPPTQIFVFKSGQGLFDYWCKYGRTDLREGQAVLAIVRDAHEMFGVAKAVKIEEDGAQIVVISVASHVSPFDTIATTLGDTAAPQLRPDDLVLWLPLTKLEKPIAEDPRTQWVGLIVAIMKCEMNAHGELIEAYRFKS